MASKVLQPLAWRPSGETKTGVVAKRFAAIGDTDGCFDGFGVNGKTRILLAIATPHNPQPVPRLTATQEHMHKRLICHR